LAEEEQRLKPTRTAFDEALISARLAEAAHLDALIKAQDAGALRLDLLRAKLLEQLPEESALRQSMALRLPPEHAPRLFLDFAHSVAMAPNGRDFVLERDHEDRRETLYTANDAAAMASDILRRAAHRAIAEERARLDSGPLQAITWGQLAYVWFTGFVVGAALLAAYAISMKIMDF
jgi:hypothetical protein